MTKAVGIDLNGLIDQVCFHDDGAEKLSTGEIPAIVVIPANQPPRAKELVVVAGVEASRSLEGRGWSWPLHAKSDSGSRRIAISDILDHVVTGSGIDVGGVIHDPAELLGAAAAGLTATQQDERPVVVAVRDNGSIDEDAQERLLSGFRSRGLSVTLLWRSVAAVLGLEDQLNGHADQLHERSIGVISVLADGIDVCVLSLEKREDNNGKYLVPVRTKPGLFVPFDQTLFGCAQEFAQEISQGDQDVARQLVWGSGAAIRAYLMGEKQTTLVQQHGNWKILNVGENDWSTRLPKPSEEKLVEAREFLSGVRDVIIEGPGLDARTKKLRMGYEVSEVALPPGSSCLQFGWIREKEGLVSTGSARYTVRQAANRLTYFDYLPGIRFAALKGGKAEFIDLIPKDARLEGGHAYAPPLFDLGLWLEPGTSELKNYLVKELSPQPRAATVRLPQVPVQRTAVQIKIFQRPLSGLARISLVPIDDGYLRPIDLDWSQMAIDGRSEEEILKAILPSSSAIPPAQPVPCNEMMWTYGSAQWPSLTSLLVQLDPVNLRAPLPSEIVSCLLEISKRLSRIDTPRRMSGFVDSDTTRYRAVSSLGEVPEVSETFSAQNIQRLDRVLNAISELVVSRQVDGSLRQKLLLLCTWTFSRCPPSVTRILFQSLSGRQQWLSRPVVFQALGRISTEPDQIAEIFESVCQEDDLKLYHLRAVTMCLSRIDAAAEQVDDLLVENVASEAIRLMNSANTRAAGSHLTTIAIQVIAGLIRGRVKSHNLLDPNLSELGRKVCEALLELSASLWLTPRNRDLAKGVLGWLNKQGTDTSVLSQDMDDEDN